MPASKSRKIAHSNATSAGKVTSTPGSGVGLYHVVYAHETFDDAAEALLQIIQKAAREQPSGPRHLFLDIDGHRNEAGGFDPDMYELQVQFITGFLGRWLTSWTIPLSRDKRCESPRQYEDVPDHLTIGEGGPAVDRQKNLARTAKANGRSVYDSATGNLVDPDGSITERPKEDEGKD